MRACASQVVYGVSALIDFRNDESYVGIQNAFLTDFSRASADSIRKRPPNPQSMPKISVEIPQELLEDLDEHVGDDGKFVNRSDAIRASIRKTLDLLDEIDERQGRLEEED